MSHRLDPKIVAKLKAFAQRRRNLILIRGICTAVAMLLATMMVVALLDWIFVLPDEVRWGLSAAAYLAVIIAEWRTCLRLLAHSPGPRRLARLIEHAAPKLREDLISAVELGTTDEKEVFDSPQFRELVQQDVAARVEDLNVDRLLPANLLKRYFVVAAAILVLLIGAFALTGSQFGTLLMRAFLPMANLARISTFQVAIVEPNPAELRVAHGDTVPLVIQVSGGRTNKAMLETFSASAGRERIQMTPAGDDRFSATIQIAHESVAYRIRAGDAITRKYQLEARARPHVVKFDKTYTFPAYAQTAARQVSEETGDLAALEGSAVDVRLQTDQAIQHAELRVDQGKRSFTVPLAPDARGQLSAKLSMDVSGTYRVHLVAAETGFENKFSPEYEIRAEPDLVPQVDLALPQHDLILPSNELVDIQGTATDDQSLARVSQLVRVNEGDWQEVSLAQNPGPTALVERRWELNEQGVKPGDLITTKLLAVDLKGNKSESRSLQITVTASGFESKRLAAVEAQRAVHQSLISLRAAADVLEKQANETRQQFEKLAESDPQRRQAAVGATVALEDFEKKAAEVLSVAQAALRAQEPGHAGAQLVLFARLASRLNAGGAGIARDALDAAAASPATAFAGEQVRDFAEQSVRAAQRARFAEEKFRWLLGGEELDLLTENLSVVADEQKRLSVLAENSPDKAAKWVPLISRMRVVAAEMRTLEQMLIESAPHLQGGYADRLRHLAKQLERDRTVIEQELKTDAPGKPLRKATAKLAETCSSVARNLWDVRRETASTGANTVVEVTRDLGPTWANFEMLRQETERLGANEKLPQETRTHLAKQRWTRRGAVFKEHGDVEEARPSGDAYFVHDVRSTTLALQQMGAVATASGLDAVKDNLDTLDRSFRVLESGHDIYEIADGLNHLAASEQWELMSARARTGQPRDWEWCKRVLGLLPEQVARIKPDEALQPVITQVQKLLAEAAKSPPAQVVDAEMRERFRPDRAPVAVPQDVERVAAAVRQALDLLRKPMEEARARLAELTPKLSEIMAQLAKEAQELKEESTAQAEQSLSKPLEQSQMDAQQTLAKQESSNERVDTLRDALRADANQQDILQQEGRERARDADDALAMLKEPPPRAEEALEEAAQSQQPQEQQKGLSEAARQQQKLADALNQLAEHYGNAEQGTPEESRMALRAQEEALGIKEQLDAQYAKAEQLARLAQASPEELLAELEKALPQNPEMRQELSSISESLLERAEQNLARAAAQEQSVVNTLNTLDAPAQQKSAAEQAAAAAKQAAEAAQQAAQSAEKSEKIGEQTQNGALDGQADKAQDLAAEAARFAQEAAQSAQQAAQAGQPPQNAQQAAQQAAAKAGEAAQKAQQAAAEAKQAQNLAEKAAAKGGDKQPMNQTAAAEAAQAEKLATQAAEAAKTAQAAAEKAAKAAQMNAEAASNQAKQIATASQAQQKATAREAMAAAKQAGAAAQKAAQAAERSEKLGEQMQNQPLDAQADKAQDLAAEAVQAAGRAAEAAQQAAQAPDAQRLQEAAQQTAQQAGEAAQKAQQAAAEAKQAQTMAQQSATQPGDKKQKSENAAEQAGQAATFAEQAAAAAKTAQAAAQQLTRPAEMTPPGQPQPASPQLAEAAGQQAPIRKSASEAGQDVSRAGRHEERLQNDAAGEQLQQLGSEISETAMQEIPSAQQALATATMPAEAAPAVAAASTELSSELSQLQAAAGESNEALPQGNNPAPAGQSAPPAPGAQASPPASPQPPSGTPPAPQPGATAQAPAPAAGQQQPGDASAASEGAAGEPQEANGAPISSMPAGTPASPQEQVWMARTLDALDAALHASATDASQESPAGQPQSSPNGQQPPQGSQSAQQALAQAQAAMAAAAQAAANAMREARGESASETPGSEVSRSDAQTASKAGVSSEGEHSAYNVPGQTGPLKTGDWGKLPKKVAEELTQGQREGIAGEYRSQIETYYRVIAEKAKKQ